MDEFLKFMAVMTKDDRFTEDVEWEGSEPKTMDKFLDYVEEKGVKKERERTATVMLKKGETLEKIKEYSSLSESAIRKLAEEAGLAVE